METSHSLKNKIGKRMARIRLTRNVTQAALAKDAGIGLRTLRRFETGQASTFDTFLRIAIALELADDLLNAFPSHDIWPIERSDTRRRERKRARPSKTTMPDKPWSWNE